MRSFKRAFSRLKFALAGGALAAAAMLQAAPVGATQATGPVALNFGTCNATGTVCTGQDAFNVASVAAGNDIAIDVFATNTGTTPTRAWQFGVTYNPASVTLTAVGSGAAGSVAYSDEFLNNARPAGANVFSTPGAIDNTLGTLSTSGDSYLGGTGGANGTARLATLHFRAVANGQPQIAFTTNSRQVDPVGNLTTALGTTTLNIGPVPMADLVVQNPNTASTTTPPGAAFNVTFVVANTGTQGGGATAPASVASVAVSNATPATLTVNVAALAPGANSGTLTAGPFTLAAGQTLSNVTITADSTNVVIESNKTNNTASSAYSFAAYNSTGNTPINASLAGVLVLTAPPAVSNFVLTAGQSNTWNTANDRLNVRSNLSSWQVNVSGENTGHLHEYDPATNSYVTTGGAELLSNLNLRRDAQPNVVLSGSPQLLVSGVRATSDPNNGNNYAITYTQFVGFNDSPVNPPHTYRTVITWAASGTF